MCRTETLPRRHELSELCELSVPGRRHKSGGNSTSVRKVTCRQKSADNAATAVFFVPHSQAGGAHATFSTLS